jgi:hypothetical protein
MIWRDRFSALDGKQQLVMRQYMRDVRRRLTARKLTLARACELISDALDALTARSDRQNGTHCEGLVLILAEQYGAELGREIQ